VTDELLVRLRENIYPEWMRARLATLLRYLSNDTDRLRLLPFVDDKSDNVGTFVSQGLGHQSYSPMSDQAIRNALEKTWSPRERAKMYALGCPDHRASSPSRRPRTRRRGRRLPHGGGWSMRPRSRREASARFVFRPMIGRTTGILSYL
jgi:hypothetical protein